MKKFFTWIGILVIFILSSMANVWLFRNIFADQDKHFTSYYFSEESPRIEAYMEDGVVDSEAYGEACHLYAKNLKKAIRKAEEYREFEKTYWHDLFSFFHWIMMIVMTLICFISGIGVFVFPFMKDEDKEND